MLIITSSQYQSFQLKKNKLFPQAKIIAWQEALQQFFIANQVKILNPIEQNFIWQTKRF